MPIWLDTRGRTKLAIAVCARCGLKTEYDRLREDPNSPGLMCCDRGGCLDVLDPWRLPARATENISLEWPRPDFDISQPTPWPQYANQIEGIATIYPTTPWAATSNYLKGASVTPLDVNDGNTPLPQNMFVCVAAGVSGTTAPAWPSQPGVQVADGTVTWLCLGIYTVI